MNVMNKSRRLISSNNRHLVTTARGTLPFIAFAALAIVLPLPAFADAASADACAKTLSPPSQMIYQATAPDIRQGVELKSVVTSHTRKLVMDGKIERSIARPSAVAAAACLKTLLE
jgi:hypothetical protein